MGLDFRIDDGPTYTINGEVVDSYEAMGLVEDPYQLDEDKTIVLTPQPKIEGEYERARWAYSGFMRFRERLARTIGIEDLREMTAFGGTGDWTPYLEHPLYPLLMHSDCDGDLSPEDCAKIAPALREAVADWGGDNPVDDYDRDQALKLAGMMDVAAANQRRLIFC